MLELTESTVTAVKRLANSSPAAGLRIFAEAVSANGPRLSAALVSSPGDDDEVVEKAGARVYLDARAAAELDDKILDAYFKEGVVRLALHDQG